jgi:hypothetical protein
MARNVEYAEIKDGENTLRFRITQMPASRLEDWLYRAALCLGPALELPEGTGLEGVGEAIAKHGFSKLANIKYGDAKPLLDEMLACAERDLGNGQFMPVSLATVDGYIETVQALFQLRVACFKANLSFFGTGVPSSSQSDGTPQSVSPTIQMSNR